MKEVSEMSKNIETVIWKTIEGYPEYQVSNLGNVKSLNYNHTGKERLLKAVTRTDGYQFVNLYRDGKVKTMLVHRLVARAFLPNPDSLIEVNHKDENKTNNNVSNLEWCDRKYNINYGSRNERSAKTQSKPVRCIETGVVFPSTAEVERQLGFAQCNISKCCNGKLKSAYKYHWIWHVA